LGPRSHGVTDHEVTDHKGTNHEVTDPELATKSLLKVTPATAPFQAKNAHAETSREVKEPTANPTLESMKLYLDSVVQAAADKKLRLAMGAKLDTLSKSSAQTPASSKLTSEDKFVITSASKSSVQLE
jgi:hypothetical protein